MSIPNGSVQEPEEILATVCAKLLSDVPSIDTALKNLLAKHTGEKTQGNEVTNELDSELLAPGLLAVRCLSRHINAMQLPPLEEWLVQNPQRDDQTATQRIDEVVNYRAAHFSYCKVREKGVKLTRAFGRQFLQFVPISPPAAPTSEDPLVHEEIAALIKEFFTSLQADYADADLVWTSDFKAALQKRRDSRQAAVAARNETFERDLRDALSSAATVEEV